MAMIQDSSVGFGIESTFNTGVTPTRWVEFLSETFDWTKGTKQGKGLRVGLVGDNANRRTNPTAQGSGDLVLEAPSKGLGLLLKAMMGNGTSTLVSGSTYQQNFSLASSSALQSERIQKGLVDITGTVQPVTFTGCTCDSFELDFTNGDILQIKSSWDIAGVTTATAYTAPSYPAEPVNLYQFANAAIYSGTLTDVTTTNLASANTALASVRGGSIVVKNNVINDRFNMNNSGRKAQQLVGNREATVKLDIELNGNTMSNNLINDTQVCLVLNYTAGSLSTGVETLQIVVPAMYADTELPKSNADSLVIQGMSFTVLNNMTNPMLEINMRTSDTTL